MTLSCGNVREDQDIEMSPYSAIGLPSSYNCFRPVEKVFFEDEAAASPLCGEVESVALCLPRIFRNVGIISHLRLGEPNLDLCNTSSRSHTLIHEGRLRH